MISLNQHVVYLSNLFTKLAYLAFILDSQKPIWFDLLWSPETQQIYC